MAIDDKKLGKFPRVLIKRSGVYRAWKKVQNYRLGYDLKKKQFLFYYDLEGEHVTHQFFPTPEEFIALADMFRNEGPISYNDEGRYFIPGRGSVGEAE